MGYLPRAYRRRSLTAFRSSRAYRDYREAYPPPVPLKWAEIALFSILGLIVIGVALGLFYVTFINPYVLTGYPVG